MPCFERYIGVDYSGAATAETSLKGLRVYVATRQQPPTEIHPPPSPRKYWTRRGLGQWLVTELRSGSVRELPTLVGIDHGFSFPWHYFQTHRLAHRWAEFLEDFHQHWPTDLDATSVEHIRDGLVGKGAARQGNSRWRRLTEERCGAKSVFHFDVQGSVAKSTHAGLPWLRHLRQQLGPSLHCWPFDGWEPPKNGSVVAEVYPALWSRSYLSEERDSHQQDAYCIARWLQETDATDRLADYFSPTLNEEEKKRAQLEGWILGT